MDMHAPGHFASIDEITLKWFGDDVAADNLLPAAECAVLWNEPSDGISDVTVAYLPARRIPDGHVAWNHWRAFSRQWDFVIGSISANWLNCHLECPDTIFLYFDVTGFATPHEKVRTFSHFGRIRECVWARAGEFEFGSHP